MDGVFMRKIIKWTVLLLLMAFIWEFTGIAADKKDLQHSVIRLHVVGASDSEEDQMVKLQVRDAVVSYVEEAMRHVMSVEEAKAWLKENIPGIEKAANDVLSQLGFSLRAAVSLKGEAFPVRHYDTFSLPSGVYESIRVTIGAGQGRNWWCVVFPSLCLPAAGENIQDVAAGAGFDQTLTNTVTGKQGYQIRFYFMDVLGKIENFFFGA